MWNRFKRFLALPDFDGDEELASQASLINIILMIVLAAVILFPIFTWISGDQLDSPVDIIDAVLLVAILLLSYFLRRGFVQQVGVALALLLWGSFTIPASIFGGIHDTAITGFFIVIILISIVAGWRTLIFFILLNVSTIVAIFFAEQSGLIDYEIAIPSQTDDLMLLVIILIASGLLLRVAIQRFSNAYDQAQTNALALRKINTQLETSRNALSVQTRQLEQRSHYLETTAGIARQVATELDLVELLPRVVELISEQFGYYHTGIFMIDSNDEYVRLRAASSPGGKERIIQNYRVAIAGKELISQAANNREIRIAHPSNEESELIAHSELPDTRSAAALPLMVSGELLGVLDLQSTSLDAFDEEEMEILQSLADQVTIAIRTALLFQQLQESIEAERRTFSTLSQDAWKEMLHAQARLGYHFQGGDVLPVSEEKPLPATELPEVTLPIRIGENVIGTIKAHKPDPNMAWTPADVSVMEALSEQLSVALENARLYEETQRRATQEQVTGEITARIRETLDIESILRTATREIRQALDLPEVVIQLGNPTTSEASGRSK
jgi:GAF domain-containing protein